MIRLTYLHYERQAEDVGPSNRENVLEKHKIKSVVNPTGQQRHVLTVIHRAERQVPKRHK